MSFFSGTSLFYIYENLLEKTKENITQQLNFSTEYYQFKNQFTENKTRENNDEKINNITNTSMNEIENKDILYNIIVNDGIVDDCGNSIFVVSLSSFLVGALGGSLHAVLSLFLEKGGQIAKKKGEK